MTDVKSHFDDLEKQLAKDALEKALEKLHGEINREIQKNKNDFLNEINKTMTSFKGNLEQHISEEIDKTLSLHLQTNFKEVSTEMKSSFHEMFTPVLEDTKNDMQRLHVQGESTLNSWKDMMLLYKDLWNRPFFLLFLTAIFTGMIISFSSSYFLMRKQRETLQVHEKTLLSYQDLLAWYQSKEKEREKTESKSVNKNTNSIKKNKK